MRALRDLAPSLLASAALLLFSLPGVADERILDFHSDVDIHADGSMTVTETILVRAEGNQIRRGIFRDFPTDYRDRLGNRFRVDFTVLSVERDGGREPFFTERQSNGVRVYIGESNTFLSAGEYEYRLRYSTDHQIGFFAEHDELYWNVTGNGWGFPIDGASARVSLPADVGADRLTMEGYTGVSGSTERAYRAEIVDGRSSRIESTRALRPREGLTLVMTWPKGVIAEPTATDRILRLLAQNLGLLIALGCMTLTVLYFLRVWHAHGRDPEAGVIFPHYEPPELISPASARHVSRMGYDRKCFTAAILDLAVKGYLEVDEDGGEYTLRPTDAALIRKADGAPAGKGERRAGTDTEAPLVFESWTPENPGPLAPGEAALLDELFASKVPIRLENKNHVTMLKAMAAHRKSLLRHNYRIYFVTNRLYVIPAIVFVVLGFVANFVLRAFTPAAIVVLVLTLLLVPVFAYLLKAPTRIGRKLLDKIEGFKLYLDVAEKDALNLKHPPEKTPELFEAYLPYALALSVEQNWGERFNAMFARMESESGIAYQPHWYHGRWQSTRGFGSMTSKMTSALGSAISSAATPPGSSSGSGGGGSSGGGGGGGGGGGW